MDHGSSHSVVPQFLLELAKGHDRLARRRFRERAELASLGRFDWAEWKSYRDEGRS
jgi:hypothetical protein